MFDSPEENDPKFKQAAGTSNPKKQSGGTASGTPADKIAEAKKVPGVGARAPEDRFVPVRILGNKSAETVVTDLLAAIRDRTMGFSFDKFKTVVDDWVCNGELPPRFKACGEPVAKLSPGFTGLNTYATLNALADWWMLENATPVKENCDYDCTLPANLEKMRGENPPTHIKASALGFLADAAGRISSEQGGCDDPIARKMRCPLLIELIWSYWHEEGMLVQTMNAISLRFQNKRAKSGRDPLTQLTIDPLRRLNNLLWGYIQDEQHRLSVVRRAYEYDQHYGLSLQGAAVPPLASADSRSKFLEAFHNLLLLCSRYYRELDDKMIDADAFPVLNALKDVHLILAEGMHNQYGDLPWTARKEMLIQQWLLARPEIREFLGGRPMVPYQETWMERVDTMKKLQGWTDTSVTHFHNLAVFGEEILLSVRFLNWNSSNSRDDAAAWAVGLRNQIQGYTHAYRAVTGVDLTQNPTDPRQTAERYLPPSVHLLRRRQLQPGAAVEEDRARMAERTGRSRVDSARMTRNGRNGQVAAPRNGALAQDEF